MDLLEFTEPGLLPKKIDKAQSAFIAHQHHGTGGNDSRPLMGENKVVMWQLDFPTPNHCAVPAL